MADVSVLIPTFNREKYIKDCIESILAQTYQNFKIIVYDDGSVDKTCEVIENIKDSRIFLYKGAVNKGVSYARNQLISLCDTPILAWQDSDDLSNIHRLELQLNLLHSYENSFVGTMFSFFKKESINIYEDPIYKEKKKLVPFATLLCWRKNLPIFNEKIIFGGEDGAWVGNLKKTLTCNWVDKILYYIRLHSNRIGKIKHTYKNTELYKISKLELNKEFKLLKK